MRSPHTTAERLGPRNICASSTCCPPTTKMKRLPGLLHDDVSLWINSKVSVTPSLSTSPRWLRPRSQKNDPLSKYGPRVQFLCELPFFQSSVSPASGFTNVWGTTGNARDLVDAASLDIRQGGVFRLGHSIRNCSIGLEHAA